MGQKQLGPKYNRRVHIDTQKTFLDYPDQETAPLDQIESLPCKATPQDREVKQINLIHRNKHKETTKMGDKETTQKQKKKRNLQKKN